MKQQLLAKLLMALCMLNSKGNSMKYSITVAYSIIQTIEVEANSKEEAQATAFDLFDESQAEICDGEIIDTKEIEEVTAWLTSHPNN